MSVVVDLVNGAIKYAFLDFGYAAAISNQDKIIQEFALGRDTLFHHITS